MLWYLGVPAVLLACAGAAALGRRLVRAAFEWRSSVVAARLWALPLLIIVWSVATVLWDPAVAPWQPWASHRLVPVVLPGLVLLGVWVSSRLTMRAAALGASRMTVRACRLLLRACAGDPAAGDVAQSRAGARTRRSAATHPGWPSS